MSQFFLECEVVPSREGFRAYTRVSSAGIGERASGASSEVSMLALIDTESPVSYVVEPGLFKGLDPISGDAAEASDDILGWRVWYRTKAVLWFLYDRHERWVSQRAVVRWVHRRNPLVHGAEELPPVIFGMNSFAPCGGLRVEAPELGEPRAWLEIDGEEDIMQGTPGFYPIVED